MVTISISSFIVNILYLLDWTGRHIATFPVVIIIYLFIIRKLMVRYGLRGYPLWIALMTISIPSSFINIFGTSYERLPISWYNVFFLFSFISWIKQSRKFHKFNIMISTLLILWLLIGVLKTYDRLNAVKDWINFLPILFYYSAIDSNLNKQQKYSIRVLLQDLYIVSALICVILLLIQVLLFVIWGINTGKLVIYPNRIAFGMLFSDFSFLSLFLVSASAICFFQKKYQFLSYLLLIGGAITSARTGIFAFFIGLIIFLLSNLNKNFLWKATLYIPALVVAYIILNFIRQEPLLESYERIESFRQSVILSVQNPILGVGLGTENFMRAFGFRIPHNIVLQMLLQIGLPGMTIFMLILTHIFILCWRQKKNSPGVFFAYIITLVGSMFIPDIMNSRFLAILIALIQAEKGGS